MRLLVACRRCRRQYDAGKRKPGTRFRCLCGQPVTIGQPRGHDAAVVRCSSCGAPREKGSDACGHCSSDFTLHERDLHTVCPACLARVSDRARYCHHCATPLVAELVAGKRSRMACPACKPETKLVSRRLGSYPLAVLECTKCAGFWLGIRELDQLFEYEARSGQAPPTRFRSSQPRRTATGYRPCIICQELMSRRNFAYGKSGVIVDLCRSHGVWFDADELARLIAWVRSGGLADARHDLARVQNPSDAAHRQAMDRGNARRGRSPLVGSTPPPVGANRSPASPTDNRWLDGVAAIGGQILALIERRIRRGAGPR